MSEKAQQEKAKLTESVAGVTGKRWCNHHQGHAPAAEGGFVLRGKTSSWMCAKCKKLRGIK